MNFIFDSNWHRVRLVMALLVLLGLILFGFVVTMFFYDQKKPDRESELRDIFKNNKVLFQTVARSVRDGVLMKRSDGIIGLEVPPKMQDIGVSVIDFRDVIFFELRSNTFSSSGLAYSPEGIISLRKCRPPTEPHFRKITDLGEGWFYYLSG